MHDHSPHGPYFISRCDNGCFHLVWGAVTLHMGEAEFMHLATAVAAAAGRLRTESAPAAVAEDSECADTLVM